MKGSMMKLIHTEVNDERCVRVYRDSDVGEYVVKPIGDNDRATNESNWYLTSDRDDANATARSIATSRPVVKRSNTIVRINAALKQSGRDERLTRCAKGYY